MKGGGASIGKEGLWLGGGAGSGCPSWCGYFNPMLAPNGITCGRGRLGSHMNRQPREGPFPFPFLLLLQRFELDTLLRFLESLEQGWGCGGGAVLINESGQRHVESGPGTRGGGGANWELGEEAFYFGCLTPSPSPARSAADPTSAHNPASLLLCAGFCSDLAPSLQPSALGSFSRVLACVQTSSQAFQRSLP